MSSPTRSTSVSSSSGVSSADRVAENKREQKMCEGWLKMVHQEIQDKQNELFENNHAALTK
jgi:hypothetical protein